MDLRDKYRTSARRGSALRVEANPLEVTDKIIDEDNNEGISIPSKVEFKIENITDAKPIEIERLNILFSTLQKLSDDNAELLHTLEKEKVPFLFTSENLIRLLDTTDSVKTKLEIVAKISQRLIDPKDKAEQLLGLFRYMEDKKRVEDCLKARIQTINSKLFKRTLASSALGSGARGRGGRGSNRRLSSGEGCRSADSATDTEETDRNVNRLSLPSKLTGLFSGVDATEAEEKET